jgi:hypothetical protein
MLYLHYFWGPRSEDSNAANIRMLTENLDKKEDGREGGHEKVDLSDGDSSIISEDLADMKNNKSLGTIEGQEFDDFDPLDFLGVYKENMQSSDDDGEPGDIYQNNIGCEYEDVIDENKLSFLETVKKDTVSVSSNDNCSKYLNFSDINSRLKNSNLSLNGGNTEGFSFLKNKKEETASNNNIQESPKKKKRIPFVKNVTPNDISENDKLQPTTESIVPNEKINSNLYNEKYYSVTSN